MNLNPSDGHIMDYTTGWDDDYDIGSVEKAFTKDYLNKTVWNMSVNSIAIVRHQRVCIRVFLLEDLQHHITPNLKTQPSLESALI